MNKSTMMTTNKISCTDQECVSLLMSFKHQTVTPPSVSSLSSNACVTLNTSDSIFKVPASDTLTNGGRNQRNSISYLGSNISNISSSSSSSSSSSRNSSRNSSRSSNNKNKTNGKKKQTKRNSKVPLDCFGSLDEYKQYRESHTPRNEKHETPTPKKEEELPEVSSSNPNKITDEKLVQLMGDTRLVELQDKDLVPDYLFLAMAQMTPCRLTDADRVGCYKEREAGFLGMCCKHCGGQPGFGKYFPATVRSLAQTTTSQTILKHIAVKCRHCPPDIRLAVVALQLQQAGKDKAVKEANGSAFESRPRYGSRKIFFHRLWSRLHGDNLPTTTTAPIATPTVKASTNLVPSRKRRRAVVSPTLTFSTRFSDGWTSNNNARPMMTNDENNMNQSNLNHNRDNMNGNNHFQFVNKNENRSRSVSYVDDEAGDKNNSASSRQNNRIGRMVRRS